MRRELALNLLQAHKADLLARRLNLDAILRNARMFAVPLD